MTFTSGLHCLDTFSIADRFRKESPPLPTRHAGDGENIGCHGAPIYDPYHPLPGLPKFQDHLQQMKAVFKDLKDAENFFTEEETNQ